MEPVTVLLNVWGGDTLRSIHRSVRSILAQTYLPEELLIVVDGPLEDSVNKYLSSIADQTSIPVRLVRIETAKGLWNARNVGLKEARTELVALQDADDVMHPLRLEIQIKRLSTDDLALVGASAVEFDSESGIVLRTRLVCATNYEISRQARWTNPIIHSSVTLKRGYVLEVGGYRDIYKSEDYDLWLRLIARNRRLANCTEILQGFAVDQTLFKRRRGWQFMRSEMMLNNQLKLHRSLTLPSRIIRLVVRLSYRLGPAKMSEVGHKVFLSRGRSEIGRHISYLGFLK